MFLGVPFNIASVTACSHTCLHNCWDLKVGDFIWTGGDCHIYQNHFDQVKQQIIRTPQAGPTLEIPKFKDLDELVKTTPNDYKLIGYNPMDTIKAPMAV